MHKLMPSVWGGGCCVVGEPTLIFRKWKKKNPYLFFCYIAFSLYNIEIHASLFVMMETANMRINKGYNLK